MNDLPRTHSPDYVFEHVVGQASTVSNWRECCVELMREFSITEARVLKELGRRAYLLVWFPFCAQSTMFFSPILVWLSTFLGDPDLQISAGSGLRGFALYALSFTIMQLIYHVTQLNLVSPGPVQIKRAMIFVLAVSFPSTIWLTYFFDVTMPPLDPICLALFSLSPLLAGATSWTLWRRLRTARQQAPTMTRESLPGPNE